eukprot:5752770-Amphidinium_carterae.1
MPFKGYYPPPAWKCFPRDPKTVHIGHLFFGYVESDQVSIANVDGDEVLRLLTESADNGSATFGWAAAEEKALDFEY